MLHIPVHARQIAPEQAWSSHRGELLRIPQCRFTLQRHRNVSFTHHVTTNTTTYSHINASVIRKYGKFKSFPKGLYSLSLSLIPGQGVWRSAPIRSKKSQRHQGPMLNFPPGQMSRRAWSWAGHCSTRCFAVSSAPLQCGQVAESWRPIWSRYPASNEE